jgi:hypothetical protein
MAAIKKPFTVKGTKVTSPRGDALWAKLDKPDREYNEKGMYSTDLVVDPGAQGVQTFIDKLEKLRDTAFDQANEGKPKNKLYTKRSVYKDDFDKDGNETGNIVFKFKMNNVDDRRPGQNKVILVGPKASEGEIPMVQIGNGSLIRCVAFANPYAMSSDKTIGVSLILEKVQLLDLVSFGGDDDLDDEDGELELPNDGLSDEEVDTDEDGDF